MLSDSGVVRDACHGGVHPGKTAVYEPGVDELVATTPRPNAEVHHRSVQAGRRCRCRVDRSRHDGHADLCYVYAAAEDIARSLSGLTVVVTNSTVPVGIGDDVERIIRETTKADTVVASNLQFQREGAAIRDFKFPDRIVLGTADECGRKVMSDIYGPLSLNQAPLVFTERRTPR
jgi:UDPglucose 6-dehydrogenase